MSRLTPDHVSSIFHANPTPNDVADSFSSIQLLQVMLELTRNILGGARAWLMEAKGDKCMMILDNPSGCCPFSFLGNAMNCLSHVEPYNLLLLEDGTHVICMDVLHTSDTTDSFYIVVVNLPARMELCDREKGLLDGLRCAFAAACINLPIKQEKTRRSDVFSHLVCCAQCRRLKTNNQVWTHWDHFTNRQELLKPVSHTICETCAIKLYGLAIAIDSQKLVNEWSIHYTDNDKC